MGLFKNLKQGLDAVRNPPTAAEIEASLASLTPEQRAAYDANMARVAAAQSEAQASYEQAVAINDRARVLEGPAGQYLYGAALREFDPTAMPDVGQMLRSGMGDFKTTLRQSFNRDEVEQESDPAERERIAAAERQARAAARAPYRAQSAVPVEVSRIATRGETQIQELAAHLARSGMAARPERVWGVYRVADRISQALTVHSEKGRVVEWDVVHARDATGPACPAPSTTTFGAGDRWVGRRAGEPSVLDEDLGVAFLRGARIGPERCLGLARVSEFRAIRDQGSEDHHPIHTLVRGLVAVHPDGDGGAFERMRAAAPIAVPVEPEGVVVETLRWEEIASAVRPKINHPPPVPSPFAYLPSTPLELLRSYLEVVGVQPEDCYSVQATVSRPRALQQGGFMTTNLGPKQPCADGKDRMRAHGCELVVIAYRDTPAYVEGRERWDRYETEVLQARLRGGGGRAPIWVDDESITAGVPTGLKTLVRAAAVIDAVTDFQWGGEEIPPYRYCWPPVT